MGVARGSILKQLRMLGICRGAAARVHTDLTLTGLETCRIAEKQTGISKDGGENIWSCPQVVSSYLGPRQFFFMIPVQFPEDRRISKILTLCNRSIWWTNLNVSGFIAFEGNFNGWDINNMLFISTTTKILLDLQPGADGLQLSCAT